MLNRFSIILFALFLNMTSVKASEIIEVIIKKSELAKVAGAGSGELDLFVLNGLRQAITKDLVEKNLDQELFWSKVEEKKLDIKAEILFLNPLFSESSIFVHPVKPVVAGAPEDAFRRANFKFAINPVTTKTLYGQILSLLPDPSLKAFYIFADITLATNLSWSDVGVSRKENFSGVILDSWKGWAKENFKNYENIVVLEKDFEEKIEGMHPESVILKWKSEVKRQSLNAERKTARFEVSAQYVLLNVKSGDSLIAFDFPTQKRDISVADPKALSSNLASLTFNLLNSQTTKVNSGLEINRSRGSYETLEIRVTGKHGLSDIIKINGLLKERFKDIQLSSELKTFASEGSTITVKSTAPAARLFELLSTDGGKFPLNEQKILLFTASPPTFAIIPN